MAAENDPDRQNEAVNAPHRDDDPPERTIQPLVWITVALVALFVMGGALIYAAVRAA